MGDWFGCKAEDCENRTNEEDGLCGPHAVIKKQENRIKLLTAELEAVAHSNAVPLFVKRSARRVLDGAKEEVGK